MSHPSFLERLHEHSQTSPEKVACTWLGMGKGHPFGGVVERTYTYKQIEELTDSLAQRLLDSGISAGDRVLLVYPPSLDFLLAFIACLKARITAVPVFPPNPLKPETLRMFAIITSGCGAKVALTNTLYNHGKKLGSVVVAFGSLKMLVGSDRGDVVKWPELKWIVTDTPKNSKRAPQPSAASGADIAFLQYTSGSTSDPKGVIITQDNLTHNLTIITSQLRASPSTIVVSWLPQYHDMGLIGSYLGALYCGGSGVYFSPLTFLQRPGLWVEAISVYQGTHVQAPNFAYKLTARKYQSKLGGGTLDLRSLGSCINAAEPIDEESMGLFYDAFGKFGLERGVIHPTYGLAEHTVFVCSGGNQVLRLSKESLEMEGRVVEVKEENKESSARIVGCGYPHYQNVDVQIVNSETCEALPEDTVGEVWVSSPSKAGGYYQQPTATRETFHAMISEDTTTTVRHANATNHDTITTTPTEYLRTGDLGFLHQRELFICGRLKDLIIVGGRNYYPQDLEGTAERDGLLRPGCSAAFSLRDFGGAEKVALVAELREVPKKQDIDAICDPLVEQLRAVINTEHSLLISHIQLLRPKTVPKTTSGKIARAWCRKGFTNNTLTVIFEKNWDGTQKPEARGSRIVPLEMEGPTIPRTGGGIHVDVKSLSDDAIVEKLTTHVAELGAMDVSYVNTSTSLLNMLDSMSISQFKGMLESPELFNVSTLSDEYLFRETTTINKLMEVVKLGYAPDDGANDTGVANGDVPLLPAQKSGGLSEAMGCPPGVYCTIM